MRTLSILAPCLVLACAAPLEEALEAGDADVGMSSLAVSSISCGERTDTGYVRGSSFAITVVTVDGKPVERDTANAYYRMAEEASRAGVEIRVVSGFRTMSEQEYFYHCYTSCSCNSCNLAARPGYSNHQSGHALDLNTSAAGVRAWLDANGARFGFSRTVPSEPWHWEWWGGGPGGGPCGRTCAPRCDGSRIVGADCGEGDCGAYGATCVDDALGVRCASVFCPARGESTVCLDDRILGTCRDGAIGTGDCGAYAAFCSTAGGVAARCVSAFCVASPGEAPVAHDVCMPNGQLARCDANGIPQDARDCASGTSCQVGADGNFACLRGGASPRGYLDAAACDGVRGWTIDDDEPEASLDVHLYFDGPPGADGARAFSTHADVHRDDLCSAIGSCAHGYRAPLPYGVFDGAEHEVRAYGINVHGGGNRALTGGPMTVRCDPPALEGVRRHIQDPESLGAWGFQRFVDELPASDEAIDALPEAMALPRVPRLASAPGSRDVYLLDGAVRRLVDGATLAAWRLAAVPVEAIDAAELAALPDGPDLRVRPMLVHHRASGRLYVIDDAPAPPHADDDPTLPEPGEPVGPGDGDAAGDGDAVLVGACAVGPRGAAGAPASLALVVLVAFALRRRGLRARNR